MFFCNSGNYNQTFKDELKQHYKNALGIIKKEKLIYKNNLGFIVHPFIAQAFKGWLPWGAKYHFRNISNPLNKDELCWIELILSNLVDYAKLSGCIKLDEDTNEIRLVINNDTEKLRNLLVFSFYLVHLFTLQNKNDTEAKHELSMRLNLYQQIIAREVNYLIITNKIVLAQNIKINDDYIFDNSSPSELKQQINEGLERIVDGYCKELITFSYNELESLNYFQLTIQIGEEHLSQLKDYAITRIPQKMHKFLPYKKNNDNFYDSFKSYILAKSRRYKKYGEIETKQIITNSSEFQTIINICFNSLEKLATKYNLRGENLEKKNFIENFLLNITKT